MQSPSARGAATLYKYRARNMVTKQKVDIVLRGATVWKRPISAAATSSTCTPTPPITTFSIRTTSISTACRPRAWKRKKFLTDELEGIQALIYNDQCVGIQLPVAVVLKVVAVRSGLKAASATSRTKPATLQTGLVVQVPEYLAQGELIKVDTRNGEFLSRA